MGDGLDKYCWTPKWGAIEDFIKKDLADGSNDEKSDPERVTNQGEALAKAKSIIDGLSVRMQEIEEDDSIPVRAKKGVKSKKVVREEAHQDAHSALKKISVNSGWTCGKWLLFPRHSDVDSFWSTIGQSVAKGPLKDTGVFLAKVAPAPIYGDDENPTHVICMYIRDVYDLKVVKTVLETLLKSHGIEPSSVKSDLYTLAGIDSNHPSKLRSTIWRPGEVISGGPEAIKKLKDEYYAAKRKANGGKAGVGADGMIESDSEDEKISHMNKKESKPSPVKKTAPETKPPPPKRAKNTGAAMRFRENDIFAGPDDDSD